MALPVVIPADLILQLIFGTHEAFGTLQILSDLIRPPSPYILVMGLESALHCLHHKLTKVDNVLE